MAKPVEKPDAPLLQDALTRWEAGDVRTAVQLARTVRSQNPSPKDAAIADDLLGRTRVPSLAFWMFGIAAVLIALMATLGAYRT